MSARILIIEDNAANLDLMSYLLHAYGYAVETARDGAEGLARARAAPPELIVCDIQMPVLDGYQVARELKSDPALRRIPLVAVTALAMVGDRERMLSSGFDGYVAKPIEPERFVPQIAAFLGVGPTPVSVAAIPDEPVHQVNPEGPVVLVVDNCLVNRELARSILEPFGYRVLLAGGVSEALALLSDTRCSLVVSDVCMADRNGYELVQAIRADPDLQALPFIFLTSTVTNEAARAHGIALGADRFLFRPIDPEVLLDEINNCLKEY